MALFNFFNKEKKAEKKSNILLAMPIFNNGDTYQIAKVVDNLRTFWGFEIDDLDGDDEAAAFQINGQMVAIANMAVPIPWDDIEGTAQYAYNWTSAASELKEHTGHAIVSLMDGNGSPLERFIILSKVLSSILITSNAVAVYQGSQSLLIPREQFLNYIRELKEDGVSVSLWVYIGLRESKKGNSAYTYGLKDFEKPEIEVIKSKLSLEELYELLYNITKYVIKGNVILMPGQTLGYTADQKIPIKLSKAEFVDGDSIKLEV